MESECENTRRWLLQAERYEDVKRFDSSAEDRERFCKERGSYHCHDVAVMEPEPDNTEYEIPETKNPEVLKRCMAELIAIIKVKDKLLKFYEMKDKK